MLKQNLKSAKKLLCSQHYDWLQTRPINTTASCNNTFLSAEGFKPVQIVQIHRGMVTVSVANCLSKTTVTDCSIATDRKQQICRIQSDATSCKPHSSDLSRHDFHLYGLLKKFLSRQFFFIMRWYSTQCTTDSSSNRNLFSPTAIDAFPNSGMRVSTPRVTF